MMFNIHALREKWDLFTIANKITTVIQLLTAKFGYKPNEVQLSEETGLTRGTIRRCRLLIDLPKRFREIILKELEKPKSKQKLTEDFFIEMETALKTVKNNFPKIIVDHIDQIRDNMIYKYQGGIIKNIVDFRKIAKLATSPRNVEYPINEAITALTKIFKDKTSGIDEVYNETVSVFYDEKKLISNFNNVLNYIQNLSQEHIEDEEIQNTLYKLKTAIEKVLKN